MAVNEQLRSLGILYCISYVVSLAVFSLALWLYWHAWEQGNVIGLLADVASTSAGTALLVIICWEGLRFAMVLFAAGRIKKIKDEGRQEGRQEGREEGLQKGIQEGIREGLRLERQKWEAWYRRFQEAQASGKPFDEPPPTQQDS
jgi:hypothetical protein